MAHVIVIEDDREVGLVLLEGLEQAGHVVRVAPDGRAGVEMHRESAADVIITDVFMPVQDGLETLIELQREFPAVPVIAMSGGGMKVSMDTLPLARHLGARSVLRKPFTIAELLAAVSASLRTAQAS